VSSVCVPVLVWIPAGYHEIEGNDFWTYQPTFANLHTRLVLIIGSKRQVCTIPTLVRSSWDLGWIPIFGC
jgi:hypothetical protein